VAARDTLESLHHVAALPWQVQETQLMERAARLLKNKSVSREILNSEELLQAVWPAAVGKVIASHTRPARLVRDKLVIEVEDAIWQRQLNALSEQIIAQLQKLTGTALLSDLEFRIAIPKRQPQRVYARQGETLANRLVGDEDEAEQIKDPVLKKVFQLSRKKATA
jgi:predicted nucleic acid-binding Zn ribbon protein